MSKETSKGASETFSEASSRRPFSTRSMLSIFPSPESSLPSFRTLSLSSASSFTAPEEASRIY